ncbi:MAG: esterase/lipase family protein [Arenicella sp.]
MTVPIDESVILLHGLARTSRSMRAMERFLEQTGYHVVNVDYPSRQKPIEELAPLAIEKGLAQCSQHNKVHFVTHSLGGILLRYYLSRHELVQLGRVVMLGPPNQGSEVIDKLGKVWGFGTINGPAGFELGTGEVSVPIQLPEVDFELGVIAGNKSINWFLSLLLPGPDDGKVTVERTRVKGMSDHIVLPVSHPYIMNRKKVMQQVVKFLSQGQFDSN